MEYRRLGKTGLRVSEIGFGCGNVGGLMVRGSLKEQIQGVSRAVDLGINYFDTSPRYGDGRSEANLGRVLRKLHPEDLVVATKVALRLEDLVDVRGAIQKSLRESLRRLDCESVDVFHLHSQVALVQDETKPRTLSVEDVLSSNGIADVFDEIKSQGLIRFSGFTGLGETEALHQLVASERFDVVQAYYNLLNPSAGFPVPTGFAGHDFKLLIRKAWENGMGIVAIRVLAAGALGGMLARQGHASPKVGALFQGADYEADVERAKNLQFLLSDDIQSLPQAGIRFALMDRAVSTVLVGFSNSSQIEEAAKCSVKNPFPRELVKKLKKLWVSNFK